MRIWYRFLDKIGELATCWDCIKDEKKNDSKLKKYILWSYSGDTIDDIDLMVSHNEANLEILGQNENIVALDNKVDKASPIGVNQPSKFEAPSSSKPKMDKRCHNHDDSNLSMVAEPVANPTIQSTNTMIQAFNTMI